MTLRIGVDTGGTFTDLFAVDTATGDRRVIKTPSTPDDPGRAILTGLFEGEAAGYWRLADIAEIVHGTTVATNTLLERCGARTAMVTTRGFRDVLAIQRQDRPKMYDLRSRRPEPLAPRELRFEITERTSPDGRVETPVDERELAALVDELAALDLQAVVVGLLHSHRNGANERRVGEALLAGLPGVSVCLSHEIAGDEGEFERFSTAVANGYVQPVVEGYLARLEEELRARGIRAPLRVMKSSGGAGPAPLVARRPVKTAVSGPAGGVRACVDMAGFADGGGNLIAADMGGTSFDVAVITGGEPQVARQASIGGLPLRIPMLDIHTIGAGGGSLAWVDAGGALRVGPESAGALPGPACYGRGGDRPTVTDANLVLGRLPAGGELSGGTTLDADAAARALATHVAQPLGLELQAVALGVLRIANAAMVAAIRKLTIERGVDPRGYTLCPYGGAGPLHAAELAEELGIDRIMLPPSPGVFSACGLLEASLREDRFTAMAAPLSDESLASANEAAERMLADASSALGEGATAGESSVQRAHRLVTRRFVALRYLGQSTAERIDLERGDASAVGAAFHEAHTKRNGFARPDHGIEVIGVDVAVELPPRAAPPAPPHEQARVLTKYPPREVTFAGGSRVTAVVDRAEVQGGGELPGPAILVQGDTTTLVPPGWVARPTSGARLELTRV